MSVNHRHAVEQIIADMVHFTTSRQARGVNPKQEGDGILAIGATSGKVRVRLYYFQIGAHMVVLRTVTKDQRKMDSDVKRAAVKARKAWREENCSGPLDTSDLDL